MVEDTTILLGNNLDPFFNLNLLLMFESLFTIWLLIIMFFNSYYPDIVLFSSYILLIFSVFLDDNGLFNNTYFPLY